MRSVVIVSPQFPPSSLAGVHRARHLAGHLPAHGWRPVVVRGDPADYLETNDPDLAALLPPDLAQEYVRALPLGLTRHFGLTDIGIRAMRGFWRTTITAARRHGASVVMMTGAPFVPLAASRRVGRATGLPVLIDFQDPWVNRVGGTRPYFSKGRMAHRLACLLEPRALAGADFVTSVSERQNEELAARHPWFDASRMAAIPIGGDPADFAKLRANPPARATHRLDPAMVNFTYVGTMLPRSGPLVEALLAAVARLREIDAALGARLRLNFVGTSNQVSNDAVPRVMPLAEAAGVADMVRETPGRVPYLEALALLANSDALMMIGSDEPHYTASKIYPNLMAGRPFLSLFHEASSAHAILAASGAGHSFAFAQLDELATLVEPMAQAMVQLAADPGAFPSAPTSSYADFTAGSVAARYAAIFDRLVIERAG